MKKTFELLCFTLLLDCGAAARPTADSGAAATPATTAGAPRDADTHAASEPAGPASTAATPSGGSNGATTPAPAPAPSRRRAAGGGSTAADDGTLECRVDADCSVSAAQQQSCEQRPECAGVSAECVEGQCRTIERRLHRSDPTLEHGRSPRASVPAACAGGVPFGQLGGSDDECNILARGLCFSDETQACACAGCAVSACSFLESYPPQAACSAD